MPEIVPFGQIDPTSFYLTSLSSNTPESIAYDIRKEFAEHPVTGLNKAELYIYGTSQAIRLAIDNIASDKRRIDALNRDLRRLLKYQSYHLGGIYHLFTRKYLDLEILEIKDKIRAGQMAISEAVPMLEDAQAELTAALSEREQIFAAVPWINVSKVQLRELCDRERLVAKLKRIGAAQSRIDPGLSENTPLLPEPLPNVQDDRHSHL